jgi:hypothetical protein
MGKEEQEQNVQTSFSGWKLQSALRVHLLFVSFYGNSSL